MQKVKIVATLGPASADSGTISELVAAGLDVVRLNFSHGTHEDHRKMFDTVHAVSREAGAHVAVMADLCGPKIRAGRLRGGSAMLVEGAEVIITTEDLMGDEKRFSTSYKQLPKDVSPSAKILLDDGRLELEVIDVRGEDINCKINTGGMLKDRKGMNIPGTPLSTPALTEKDREDLEFARELGVDYFALSFVRSAQDVRETVALARGIPVIAKIEKPEAIDQLKEIIEAADGVMVARGDLGVEAGAEKVPLLQKRIIRWAAARGKPVIVATQMLDSMINHPHPTRAEVSDVANAVLDGTDAVMLSGETASGKYPVQAVKEMASILEEVEGSQLFEAMPHQFRGSGYSFSNAIARACVAASEDLSLKALAVYSETGHSAALVSALRPIASIVALSRHEGVLRRLALRWGVLPVFAEWAEGIQGVVEQAQRVLRERDLVSPGDDIAITFGMRDMTGPGSTDVLKLWRIKG